MRRLLVFFAAVVALALSGGQSAWAQDAVSSDSTVPNPTSEVPATTIDPSVSTLPAGCTPPDAADIVFIGRFVVALGEVGRFVVTVVREDPQHLLDVGRAADIRLSTDLRFLHPERSYLVAARHTPDDALVSKVRQPLPLFGTDLVVGADDGSATCPKLSDPIVVRNDDGSPVDTGVLSAFIGDRRGILFALLKPTLGVALGLLAIWGLRRLVLYAVRGWNEMFGRQ